MILDDVTAAVSAQLHDQSMLGVEIQAKALVPEKGPVNGGVWVRVPNVTAVFADLKGSTELSATCTPRAVARAYTYFIRAMTIALERFGARYIDIQGDGIFGLFSGKGSAFHAAACAITMRTHVEDKVEPRFKKETSNDWSLTAGFGIDQGALLVRRLGLRGTKQNEVWAGTTVNVAAKLSSLASPNEVVVSPRVFDQYLRASELRRRALLWDCSCDSVAQGAGLEIPAGQTDCLWYEGRVPEGLGLDFEKLFWTELGWCELHGPEFCEALIANRLPS